MSVFQAAMPTGSYPNMGAGYLAKRQYLSAGTTNLGWYKIGSVSVSELNFTDNFSVILLLNGIYASQGQSGAAESGIIEFEGRQREEVLETCRINILAGNLNAGDLSCVIGDNSCDLYLNMPSLYNSFEFTVINEARTSTEHSDLFTFDTEFYGASAPSGAVYAVVRNNASFAESAGHLQEIQINTRSSDTVGWYKCGEFDISRNTGAGDLSCSVILQINGANYGNYSESAINAAPSGQIEVDARITSGVFVNRYSSVGIICGNIASTDFCICSSDDGKKMNLYVNISHRYRDFKITKISEGQENVPSPNIFEFTDEYYGTTAPEGAVYAVVRNNASADDNGYSFDTNYVWHNNGQVEVNTLKDGTTSLDFNDYLEEGKYELHGNADNTAVNFPTSSSNSSATNCDWYLVVYRRSSTYVTQVAYSVRADNAISIRSRDNGKWREWRLLFEDGVAQSIPTASETVIGGVKVYRDSDGYLNIDTQ